MISSCFISFIKKDDTITHTLTQPEEDQHKRHWNTTAMQNQHESNKNYSMIQKDKKNQPTPMYCFHATFGQKTQSIKQKFKFTAKTTKQNGYSQQKGIKIIPKTAQNMIIENPNSNKNNANQHIPCGPTNPIERACEVSD